MGSRSREKRNEGQHFWRTFSRTVADKEDKKLERQQRGYGGFLFG